MLLTKEIVKAGRALLDWTQRDLARQTGLSIGTIARFEAGTGMQERNNQAIHQAMQRAGLQFIASSDAITGVMNPQAPANVLRAGRALLDWTQERMASRYPGLSKITIRSLETAPEAMSPAEHRMIYEALEQAGIEFIYNEDDIAIGVNKKIKETVQNG